MFKRILAATMAATMFMMLLASCGEKTDPNATTVSGQEQEISGLTETGETSSTTSGKVTSGGESGPTGGSVTPSGSNGSGGPKREIKIWWDSNDESMQAAAREWRKRNSGVTFNINSPADSTVGGLKRAYSANQEPDVVSLDHVYITSLGREGIIYDLSQFGANKVANKYISSCWDGVSFNKKVYGLPHNGNTIALIYNKDMFDKINKKAPKTYEDIVKTGQALNKQFPAKDAFTSPFFDTADQGRWNWATFVYFFWLWRSGGEVLNSSLTKSTFNSSAGVNALNKLVDLVDKYDVCYGQGYRENEFYNGDVGMIEMGNWCMPKLTSASANANFGVAMMPTLIKGGKNYSGLGLFAVGITSRVKKAQEVYDFLEFYTTNDTYQVQYGKQYHQLPVTKNAIQNSHYTKNAFWSLYSKQYKLARSRPGVKNWSEMEKVIAESINKAVTKQETAKTALDNAAKKINALLAK